jgi:uncharacterized circularly permuted ATP-grasp superfamily protein
VVCTGGVGIANPLGSGVLESPALMPFLPRLSRHLLGEDLRLPSVPSWWCGDPVQCWRVLARLEHLVIKTAHPGVGFRFVSGSKLSTAERAELADHVRARPHLFVGQEALDMSTVPVLAEGRLEARRSVLRTSPRPGGVTTRTWHP